MTTLTTDKPSIDMADPPLVHRLVPAGRVKGAPIYNLACERLGRVKDIALDKATGEIAYVIVASGGFMGLGETHRQLPWSALTYDTRLRGYVVAVAEALRLAPKLDVTELSGWDDTRVREDLIAYYGPYGARPYW